MFLLKFIIYIIFPAPPSYEECTFGTAKTIMDTEDNEHTQVGGGWAPRYPTYNFAPSAPTFS